MDVRWPFFMALIGFEYPYIKENRNSDCTNRNAKC